MRLSILDHGHRTRAKLFLKMTATMSRVDNPDIVKDAALPARFPHSRPVGPDHPGNARTVLLDRRRT